ncbi:MAG: ABC transporter, partial [Microlunatus sp.]|nr:ABC transporter [Microlunatus sp.]
PWEFLRSAADRSAAVAVVLDRVPPRAMAEVPAHLGRLMADRGLGRSPLFAVPETDVDADGLLPTPAVQPIRSWLAGLAADQASRAAVVHQTLDGAIAAVARRAPEVARAIDEQAATLELLRAEVDSSYAEAVRTIAVQTADGTLLRGEVLARWQEFVGTGEFFRAMEKKIGWLRDKVTAVFTGEPAGTRDLKVAVGSGLESLLGSEGDAAAERADGSWQAHAAGRQLLARSPEDLTRASPEFGDRAARAIRDWQGAVLDLVADTGMAKRSRARFMALGVNGVGMALMIVVFAQTGGITGAEVGIAGGTTVLAQRVLEAVFGDQAVRRLASTAKEELDARVAELMSGELLRFHRLLDAEQPERGLAEALRTTAAAVAAELAAVPLPDGSASGSARSAEPVALPGARPALEPPTVRQVAEDQSGDLVDAELVEETDPPFSGGQR